MREAFRRDMLSLRVGYPVREVRDLTIPGPAGPIPARYYRSGHRGPPVVLVYFHGGGFIMGDLDTHDDACRLLARDSGMAILSVEYRLAPEHPFPTGLEDAEAAASWAEANLPALGGRALAIGGDSAGANLAAVVAQRFAAQQRPLVAQLLIYPGTDLTVKRPSHSRFGQGFFLNAADRERFYGAYLSGNSLLGADHRVSPLLNPSPGRLAPALIVTAGFDMLCDEGTAYASYLTAHGIAVEQMQFGSLGHGFINLVGVHNESQVAVTSIAHSWRTLCHRALTSGNRRLA